MQQIPLLAIRNRQAVEESETCGCYCCSAIFSKLDIAEWTDNNQTAICPFCGTDAVLAQTSGISLDKEALEKIGRYWFSNDK